MVVTDLSASLGTHEVVNQPPPLEDYNAFESDAVLVEGLAREGGGWAVNQARDFGALEQRFRVGTGLPMGRLLAPFAPYPRDTAHPDCRHP